MHNLNSCMIWSKTYLNKLVVPPMLNLIQVSQAGTILQLDKNTEVHETVLDIKSCDTAVYAK